MFGLRQDFGNRGDGWALGFATEVARRDDDTRIVADPLDLPGGGIGPYIDLPVGDTMIDRARHRLAGALERQQNNLTRLVETSEVPPLGIRTDVEGVTMAHLVHHTEHPR